MAYTRCIEVGARLQIVTSHQRFFAVKPLLHHLSVLLFTNVPTNYTRRSTSIICERDLTRSGSKIQWIPPCSTTEKLVHQPRGFCPITTLCAMPPAWHLVRATSPQLCQPRTTLIAVWHALGLRLFSHSDSPVPPTCTKAKNLDCPKSLISPERPARTPCGSAQEEKRLAAMDVGCPSPGQVTFLLTDLVPGKIRGSPNRILGNT